VRPRLDRPPRRAARPAILAAATLAAAGSAFVSLGRAQDEGETARATELTAEARTALEGALTYLANEQGQDGSSGEHPEASVRLATTSLAGLAFLAGGSTPSRGAHHEHVKRSLEYVLSKARRIGDAKNAPVIFGDAPPGQQGRMHAHGFAMLFLAESYGMLSNPKLAADVKATLEGAVKLSLASQTKARGGWGYAFGGEGDFLQGVDEASTTITQIQGLRAARNIGIVVPAKTIDRAVDYVKRCIGPNGECRYSLTMQEGDRTSFELTAAAVATLNASGAYQDEKLTLSLAAMRRFMQKKDKPTKAANNYYFYGNLYAAQAMFQAGGADWATWFKGAQEDLLANARSRGGAVHWEDPRQFGDAYATASAALILALPLRYLPIFER
jgi:hypothetical protein